MKKIFVFGILFLAIIGLGLYFTTQYFLGGIVKSGVNKFGPGITQTRVELEGAHLSPLSGEGTLTGLVVGNPKGWTDANAFRLGKVHVKMQPFSVMADHIVIDELIIEQPEFLYETKIISSNISDLLKNIEQSMGGKSADPKTKDGKPVKMEIKKLALNGGRVTLGVGGAAMVLPMPAINMADIGSAEGGLTPAQIAFAVMRNVTSGIVSASTGALTKLGGTSGAASMEGAKQVGEAIMGIFGGQKKNAEPNPTTAPAKK
jgi:hypothetical protein